MMPPKVFIVWHCIQVIEFRILIFKQQKKKKNRMNFVWKMTTFTYFVSDLHAFFSNEMRVEMKSSTLESTVHKSRIVIIIMTPNDSK